MPTDASVGSAQKILQHGGFAQPHANPVAELSVDDRKTMLGDARGVIFSKISSSSRQLPRAGWGGSPSESKNHQRMGICSAGGVPSVLSIMNTPCPENSP